MFKIITSASLTVMMYCIAVSSFSQTPGTIVRPAGGGAVTKLNPNGDSWSSASATGYTANDISESEVSYKVIPATFFEPTGDLNRGPSGGFSDLVRNVDGSGFYSYFDGTNLYFRLRVGGIVSGSKGYSVLIDADGKFGNSGNNSDPNYVANSSGSNGNPGFEWEVVLETNSRIAVYSVDGTNTPVFVTSYPLATHHQISIANSFASSDPDYFYDFYVPISATASYPSPIASSTSLRMIATTVMSPRPATGGPISDIFGINNYVDPSIAFTSIIKYQTPFSPNNIQTATSVVGSVMTAAPTLTTPVNSGSNVTITGTWVRLDTTKSLTATIKLYKNGAEAGSATVTSGATWSILSINVSQNDIFYVSAKAANEALSPPSNNYKVLGCTAANTTSTTGLSFSCVSNRGMQGNKNANTSIKIYKITAENTPVLYADDANFTYKVTYGTTTTWRYDSIYTQSSSACTGGQADINAGQYAITATQTGYCESAPLFTGGCSLGNTTATPVITQTALYEGNTIVSGTAAAGTTVKLYKNGLLDTSVILASGATNYTFTNRLLYKNDFVEIRSQSAGQCESTGTTRTVLLITSTPFVNTSSNGTLIAGATSITGKSSEPAETVITIYENGVSKGTATVQSDGLWSFTYTVLPGKTYYAAQQRTGADMSPQTPAYSVQTATTAVPAITGAYTEAASPVVINIPAGFAGKVFLYEDGQKIDSISVSNNSIINIPVNTSFTNKLYTGGILTATAQATGSAENTTTSNAVTVTCAVPAVPTISPVSSTVYNGEKVTFKITAANANVLFTLKDSVDQKNLSTSAFGTGQDLNITSFPFTTNGNISVRLKSTLFSGPGCESYAAATVNVIPLPTTILKPGDINITGFNAGNGDIAFVSWVDLLRNTEIKFTNNGWLSAAPTTTANNARNLEEIATWTNTTGSTIKAGTVIILKTATPYTTNYGSTTVYSNSGATNPSMQLQGGDEITVYQTNSSGTGFKPDNSATATFSGIALAIVSWPFNWAISGAVTNSNTYLPSDLAANSTVFLNTYLDPYFQYTGTRIDKTISGYKTELQQLSTNWKVIWGVAMNPTSFGLATLSNNANLSSLTISSGSLSPLFSANTLSYYDTVANNISAITVMPAADQENEIVKVNGTLVSAGKASDSIALHAGLNTIIVEVMAEDGITTKTYTITAVRMLQKPVAPNLTKSSDLGISNTDNITSNNTPVFVGTADANAAITLYDKNLKVGSGITDSAGKWTVTSDMLANGSHSLRARSGLDGLESSLSNTLTVIIDKEAPIINSVRRQNPDTAVTSAGTVTYRIIYSEKINGLTADDFVLTASGTAAGTIASVSSDSGTVIDVTVDNIAGEGTLRLDARAAKNTSDVAGNLLTGEYITGEEYTIVSETTLPVTLTDFKAVQKENAVEVSWKATTEINIKKYEIERSAALVNFKKAGEIFAKGSMLSSIYSFTDNSALQGNNFYRLKTIDKDGTIKYSEIKAVNFSTTKPYFHASPNPVVSKTLNLKAGNIAAGKYQLTLFDFKGQKVYNVAVLHDGGTWARKIQLPSSVAAGVYTLHFTNTISTFNEVIIIK